MTDDLATRLTRAAEGKFDGMSLDLFDEAAQEIRRLRAQIADLLPYAHADAESGASTHQWASRHDCEPLCEDCRWHVESVALLKRIKAGEFQQP